jgi:hypothetical protein
VPRAEKKNAGVEKYRFVALFFKGYMKIWSSIVYEYPPPPNTHIHKEKTDCAREAEGGRGKGGQGGG